MKVFFFILLSLISMQSSAVLEDQLAVRPDRDYMQFFLKGYLHWFETNFHFEIKKNQLVEESLKKIDHWRTPEVRELDQLLIGQGFNDQGSPTYFYRVYVQPELRKSPLANSYPAPPHFLEWAEETGLCYLTPVKDFDSIKVPFYEGTIYYGHFCRDKNGPWKLSAVSFIGKDEELAFPNPFRGQSDSVWKTYDKEGVKLNQYFVKSTHLGLIPKEHIPFINKHGGDILLPFDKYSLDRRGRMIIYYP